MPTVFTLGWGRIFVRIYTKDHEPPHVHVIAPGAKAKWIISTATFEKSRGFSEAALRKIDAFLVEHQEELQELWEEYHDGES